MMVDSRRSHPASIHIQHLQLRRVITLRKILQSAISHYLMTTCIGCDCARIFQNLKIAFSLHTFLCHVELNEVYAKFYITINSTDIN